MHATPHAKSFTAAGWLFEMMLDRFRALARRRGAAVELLSRTGRRMGNECPEIINALERTAGEWVLDAELVVPDGRGHPSFESTRRRAVMRRRSSIITAAAETPAALCVFDVLIVNRRDVRALPLVERKARLREIVEHASGIQIVGALEAHGEALFDQAVKLDIEGIVAKRLDAPYFAGRQLAWLKIKNRNYSRQEALGFRR
jgi:bifunctional non-homologous end joining protein LigD